MAIFYVSISLVSDQYFEYINWSEVRPFFNCYTQSVFPLNQAKSQVRLGPRSGQVRSQVRLGLRLGQDQVGLVRLGWVRLLQVNFCCLYLLIVTNYILLGGPYFALVLCKKPYKKLNGQFNIEKPLNSVERFENAFKISVVGSWNTILYFTFIKPLNKVERFLHIELSWMDLSFL